MPRLLCPLLTVAVGIAFVSPAHCAEKNASELELKTVRVIVFKDGYTLIIKRGVATTDKAGEVFTDEVPDAAVLGSFWVPLESIHDHRRSAATGAAGRPGRAAPVVYSPVC